MTCNSSFSDDDGFALVEVLAAFVIVTLGLMSIYSAMAGQYRQGATVNIRQSTLAYAESHLEELGGASAITPGTTTGTYANGASWRLVAVELPSSGGARALAARPLAVSFSAFDTSRRQFLRLKTVYFATESR